MTKTNREIVEQILGKYSIFATFEGTCLSNAILAELDAKDAEKKEAVPDLNLQLKHYHMVAEKLGSVSGHADVLIKIYEHEGYVNYFAIKHLKTALAIQIPTVEELRKRAAEIRNEGKV